MRAITSILALGFTLCSSFSQTKSPPPGFEPLFNGRDLTGWYGWGTKDPALLRAMSPDERSLYKKRSVEGGLPGAESTEHINAHWRVENGELVNDGKGLYLTTEKDYGDFELWV